MRARLDRDRRDAGGLLRVCLRRDAGAFRRRSRAARSGVPRVVEGPCGGARHAAGAETGRLAPARPRSLSPRFARRPPSAGQRMPAEAAAPAMPKRVPAPPGVAGSVAIDPCAAAHFFAITAWPRALDLARRRLVAAPEPEAERRLRRGRVARPSASSTWLGAGPAELQAEPVETASPASASSSRSPSTPSKRHVEVARQALGRMPVAPHAPASAPRAARAAARAARRRRAASASRSATASSSARAEPHDRWPRAAFPSAARPRGPPP